MFLLDLCWGAGEFPCLHSSTTKPNPTEVSFSGTQMGMWEQQADCLTLNLVLFMVDPRKAGWTKMKHWRTLPAPRCCTLDLFRGFWSSESSSSVQTFQQKRQSFCSNKPQTTVSERLICPLVHRQTGHALFLYVHGAASDPPNQHQAGHMCRLPPPPAKACPTTNHPSVALQHPSNRLQASSRSIFSTFSGKHLLWSWKHFCLCFYLVLVRYHWDFFHIYFCIFAFLLFLNLSFFLFYYFMAPCYTVVEFKPHQHETHICVCHWTRAPK